MENRRAIHLVLGGLLLVLLAGVVAACGGGAAYLETFDEPGSWRTEKSTDVTGEVRDGVYDFLVSADELSSWTTAGQTFSDGRFQVEAMQVDGPDNNAFGLIFRVDDQKNDFYAFQISGDGFVWIGRYINGGSEEAEPIVGDWWFESTAVSQGAGVTNKLTVDAEGSNLIFYVNDQEVGRVTDNTFKSGDIGLLVRSLGAGGVHVQFDNFSVTPLSK